MLFVFVVEIEIPRKFSDALCGRPPPVLERDNVPAVDLQHEMRSRPSGAKEGAADRVEAVSPAFMLSVKRL